MVCDSNSACNGLYLSNQKKAAYLITARCFVYTMIILLSVTHQLINGQERQGDPDVHLLTGALEERVVPVQK